MLERMSFDLSHRERTAMPQVVQGLIPRGVVMIVAGAPGFGKTMFGVQAGVATSLGIPFLGHAVERPLGVLLLAYEDNQDSIHRRTRACVEQISSIDPTVDVGLVNTHFHVLRTIPGGGGTSFSGVAADLSDYFRGMERQQIEPGLVIIDTLSNVLVGDENEAGSARGLFAEFRQLAVEHNVSVLFTHHTRKSATGERRARSPTPALAETIRGSSAIVAGARLVLALVPTGSPSTGAAGNPMPVRTANLVVAKSNDGPEGGITRLKMDPATGLWELDESSPTPERSASPRIEGAKRPTRRDLVLQVLANTPEDGITEGRRAALRIFEGDPNPSASLRSALRDLRVKGLVDVNDQVTALGRVHIERLK